MNKIKCYIFHFSFFALFCIVLLRNCCIFTFHNGQNLSLETVVIIVFIASNNIIFVGSTEIVRTLLEGGAKPYAVNKIKRTASQLGAFVGMNMMRFSYPLLASPEVIVRFDFLNYISLIMIIKHYRR